MFNKLTIYLKNLDWIMFSAIFLLICFGLVEIYSVALGQNELDFINFKKQIFSIMAGIAFFFALAFFDYHNLRSYSNYIYVLGIIMLLLVLGLGSTIRGTKGWFDLAGFGIQPVEFVKLILILFLARYFSSASLKANPLKHLIMTGIGTLIFASLVLAQPDFGSSLLLFIIWLSMLVFAGFKKKYFIFLISILLISLAIGWTFLFKPYQKQRILTFFNPSFNPLEQGYNVSQAIIAVGAGGLFGRGLGFGSQSQLKFLPEAQTDFIFAVVAEELGFLGVALILIFFSIFFYRCIASLKKINNDFGVFFILGSVSLIFVEMFVNIGMNIGLLPVVGISLPFLSYGGSGMLSSLMLAGVIESIIIRSKINY